MAHEKSKTIGTRGGFINVDTVGQNRGEQLGGKYRFLDQAVKAAKGRSDSYNRLRGEIRKKRQK